MHLGIFERLAKNANVKHERVLQCNNAMHGAGSSSAVLCGSLARSNANTTHVEMHDKGQASATGATVSLWDGIAGYDAIKTELRQFLEWPTTHDTVRTLPY